MHLRSCDNPIRVYNKYLDEYVWVSCGKCPTCRKNRAQKWVSRLEDERKQHLFSVFVTLTYDESHLPLCHIQKENLVSDDGRICIPFDELEFLSSADADFFNKSIALRGIAYADKYGFQLFNKRLNKYFHDNVTSRYKNFRFFAVSEFGSTTLRPHIHCIYFIDSAELAGRFGEGVASAWSLGRFDTQIIEKTASSYVAQYLNELFELPSFYEHSSLRPWFTFSRRPSIGSYNEYSEDDKEIFDKCITQRFAVSEKDSSLRSLPLQRCTENRIFPKFIHYNEIPSSFRIEVYRCAQQPFKWLGLSNFKNWLSCLKGWLSTRPDRHECTFIRLFLSCIAQGFSEKGINALKRIYYVSRRVLYHCAVWNVSLQEYVDKIELYWSKRSLRILKDFYIFQSQYAQQHNVEEIAYMYPEYMHQQGFNDFNYVIPASQCYDIQLSIEEGRIYNEEETKSHFKNAYFDRQVNNNNPFFKLLNSYYNAKKCNEAFKTTS